MNTQFRRNRALTGLFSACLTLGLTACTDDGGDELGGDETGGEGLEIVGEYVDDYGSMHSISEAQWTIGDSVFELAEYDNVEMWAVAQNAPGNEFNPELWSRFDWTWAGDQLYYCQSAYDAMTVEDAKAGGADPDNLQTGCGMFPWSMLDPQ